VEEHLNKLLFVVADVIPDGDGGFEPLPPGPFTIEQAAHYCQCKESTIRNYITAGKLKAVRIGKENRITREELDRFIKKQTEN
jgi:excisionase family DNA binding protein